MNEKELFTSSNGKWRVTVNPSGVSGWVEDTRGSWSTAWILYDNGNLAFDNPYRVPQYIKVRLYRELKPSLTIKTPGGYTLRYVATPHNWQK